MIRITISIVVNDIIKLESESVVCDTSLTDMMADVGYCVSYRNDLKENGNAQIIFPLKNKAAVYLFEAQIGDRTIRGKCMEKEEAKSKYKAAIKKGAFAFHGYYNAADILSLDVGNISPGESVFVKLRYVIQLDFNESSNLFTFTLPVEIVPRYNPRPELMESTSVKGCHDKSEFVSFLSFCGKINAGGKKIEEIYSNVAEIVFEPQNDSECNFRMASLPKKLADICLYLKYDTYNYFTAIVEKGLGDSILMLSHIPSFEERKVSEMTHEFIFITDRSGSMSGNSIKRAAEALKVALMSLPPKAYYNIIGFGSAFEEVFENSVPIEDQDSRRKALRYIAHMEGDMGGTEILRPIQHVLGKELQENYTRKIILITDGDVSNYNEVIYEISKNAKKNRVFSIGIGSGASSALVEGVVEAGNGSYEHVDSSATDIDLKIIKLMADATKNVITESILELPCLEVENHFPRPRSVYINKMVYTDFYKIKDVKQFEGNITVTVNYRGHIEGTPYDKSVEIPVVFMEEDNMPIHRFAAKNFLARIPCYYSDDDFKADKDGIKSSALAISLASNIISRVTSFVGIDGDDLIVSKAESEVFCSTRMSYCCFSNSIQMCSAPVPLGSPSSLKGYDCCEESNDSCDNSLSSPNSCLTASLGSPVEMEEDMSSSPESSIPMDVLYMQRFDGIFIVDDEFFNTHANICKETFNREFESLKDVTRDEFFTVLCIVYLKKFFSHKAEVLQLIIRKAVDALGMESGVLDALKDRAALVIRE